MARAVAFVSLTPSRTSRPEPSSLQRLMVLFPELTQYSCSVSKSMDRPGDRGEMEKEAITMIPDGKLLPIVYYFYPRTTHPLGPSDWWRGQCGCCRQCWPCWCCLHLSSTASWNTQRERERDRISIHHATESTRSDKTCRSLAWIAPNSALSLKLFLKTIYSVFTHN